MITLKATLSHSKAQGNLTAKPEYCLHESHRVNVFEEIDSRILCVKPYNRSACVIAQNR